MMRVSKSAVLAILALWTLGSGTSHATALKMHMQGVQFRLHVVGRPTAGTTFWVAHGPLAGRFGLIRLRSAGSNMYEASAELPGAGKTTFAYLAGHGSHMGRSGPVPGDPVITVERVGPVPPAQLRAVTVQWSAPVG